MNAHEELKRLIAEAREAGTRDAFGTVNKCYFAVRDICSQAQDLTIYAFLVSHVLQIGDMSTIANVMRVISKETPEAIIATVKLCGAAMRYMQWDGVSSLTTISERHAETRYSPGTALLNTLIDTYIVPQEALRAVLGLLDDEDFFLQLAALTFMRAWLSYPRDEMYPGDALQSFAPFVKRLLELKSSSNPGLSVNAGFVLDGIRTCHSEHGLPPVN